LGGGGGGAARSACQGGREGVTQGGGRARGQVLKVALDLCCWERGGEEN